MFESVVLTSVPAKEVAMAREALPGARVLTDRLSQELAEAHGDAEVLSVMVHDPVDPDILGRFPKLRGIVTRSTGFDHLPLEWLRGKGIEACHLSGYATSSVAHLTLGLMITMLRRVPEAMAVTQGAKRGGDDPPRWDRSRLAGRHLLDVRVGLLGTGRIGSEVARLLSAMGASVVAHDLRPDPEVARLPNVRYVEALPDFLGLSDVLSLHVPLTPATRQMIDRGVLARLPPGAILINTARGSVVDQLAVERALRSARLGGYAADVMPGEPDVPHLSRFRDFTNVMLTPHLGAYDTRAIATRYQHTADAARAILTSESAGLAAFRVPLSS